MFGQTTLFGTQNPAPAGKPESPRRRNFLIPERNILLAHRFYYYDHIKGLKSVRCLEELSKEFFLAEARLIDLIYELSDEINLLRVSQPSTRELQNKFPWINWNM